MVFTLPIFIKIRENPALLLNYAFHDEKYKNEIEVISCSPTFDEIHSQKWLQCPTGCRHSDYDVIGGENGFYSGKSHICKSAIHAGVLPGKRLD